MLTPAEFDLVVQTVIITVAVIAEVLLVKNLISRFRARYGQLSDDVFALCDATADLGPDMERIP
ncbi:hypothetical protein [Actinoplanes sp. NPDC051494]|uniref:hypothetical protein n=1 Tax=Actinoplanes sp. NPDC051494 TaxID=3363907 RepID=UPI0037896305